ncbi:hypothetical protein SAMN02745136_04272 [Anaerocolumna jejuensis DSM 15929]|uniref:Yip1 domain-containing protein n=1 Tax=Anaerocolumna jejuensis DSM 15929 TaxID=1121322 RepID=A0A1M6YHV7_9FIRM|nr:hypothetical protein [Anaerocolumna jejuensis]SHL17712.1 hypothetical protein SAMN02745136_04272 [Anaerocolumna jejuensis DSM 15929]
MGKFCIHCGRKLEDGEVCGCLNSQKTDTPCKEEISDIIVQEELPLPLAAAKEANYETTGIGIQEVKAMAATSNVYLKKLFDIIIKVIKKPDTGLRSYIEKPEVNIAVGIIVLESLLYGLYLTLFFQKMNAAISSLMGQMMGSFGGLFGGSGVSLNYSFPLVRIFIVSVIWSIALNGILAGIVLILNKLISNGQADYKSMLCVVSGKSIAMILITAIAVIIGFLNPMYGLVCYSAGAILSCLYLYASAKPVVSNADKLIYIVFLSLILIVVVNLIAFKLGYKLYLPKDITSSLGGMSGLY